jgi:hypothetical protein
LEIVIKRIKDARDTFQKVMQEKAEEMIFERISGWKISVTKIGIFIFWNPQMQRNLLPGT